MTNNKIYHEAPTHHKLHRRAKQKIKINIMKNNKIYYVTKSEPTTNCTGALRRRRRSICCVSARLMLLVYAALSY